MPQAVTRKDAESAVDDWMSLNEAATTLGETRLAVLTRFVKGEIVAQHIAGRTVVERASVERALAVKKSA